MIILLVSAILAPVLTVRRGSSSQEIEKEPTHKRRGTAEDPDFIKISGERKTDNDLDFVYHDGIHDGGRDTISPPLPSSSSSSSSSSSHQHGVIEEERFHKRSGWMVAGNTTDGEDKEEEEDEEEEGEDLESNCTHPRQPLPLYNDSCDYVHVECRSKSELIDYLAFVLCTLPEAQVYTHIAT